MGLVAEMENVTLSFVLELTIPKAISWSIVSQVSPLIFHLFARPAMVVPITSWLSVSFPHLEE
jgi:hypothetical protein